MYGTINMDNILIHLPSLYFWKSTIAIETIKKIYVIIVISIQRLLFGNGKIYINLIRLKIKSNTS